MIPLILQPSNKLWGNKQLVVPTCYQIIFNENALHLVKGEGRFTIPVF